MERVTYGMGRGLGALQKSILDVLATQPVQLDPFGVEAWALPMTMAELVEVTDRPDSQVRAACDALERRGLVVVERRTNGERDHQRKAPSEFRARWEFVLHASEQQRRTSSSKVWLATAKAAEHASFERFRRRSSSR
jgi:predicted transcriptional regulator